MIGDIFHLCQTEIAILHDLVRQDIMCWHMDMVNNDWI